MIYDLSLSSNYVSDWTVNDAIRELLQNAIDSTGEMIIKYEDDYLTIINKGVSIDKSTLLLGESDKPENSIGQFGEGYKLALLVLIRNGHNVTIDNGSKRWLPSFRLSDLFGQYVLSIREVETGSGDDLIFNIEGPFDLDDLCSEFPILKEHLKGYKYDCIDTTYGELIKDPDYKGKIYVGGLYVDTVDFEYGYNFKPEYVDLGRDRRAINIYKLRKLTCNIITELDDYDIIDNVLNKGSDDAYNIKNDLDSVRTEFKEGYGAYLADQYSINEDMVAVSKNADKTMLELRNRGVSYVEVPNKTFSDIINHGSSIMEDVENSLRTKSKRETAFDYYNDSNYKKLYDWGDKKGVIDDEFEEILEDLEPIYFDLIRDEVR